MTHANTQPADAPSEFKCRHCSNTMTQPEVRAMCTAHSDEPAYLICSSCLSRWLEQDADDERREQDYLDWAEAQAEAQSE
jgi:Zn finger protein HypA/HybF involved in hydrogenase expression